MANVQNGAPPAVKHKFPNPIAYVLDLLFPPKYNASGSAAIDASAIDAETGLTQSQIASFAKSADQTFAGILGVAGAAATAATAPGGAPFVAGAAAAVATYWSSLPAKKKAAIWIGKG